MVWRTTFITISTCFLLGTTFTHWIADHDVLWKRPLTDHAIETSVRYYSLLASAPKGLLYAYLGVGCLTLLSAGGRLIKVFKGGKGEVVFDGGSIVLLAAIVHTQLTETMPSVLVFPTTFKGTVTPVFATAVKDLASDNIRCAVMLTGIMLLQAGRHYSKRPSRRPTELSTLTDAASPQLVPVSNRTSTPYRELTEEEAFDLQR